MRLVQIVVGLAVVALIAIWSDTACKPGDQGIMVGHMLVAGCK